MQEFDWATTLIEIVNAWGVTPSLSPGMGAPLDLRLENVSLFCFLPSSPLATTFSLLLPFPEFDMSTTRVGGYHELEECSGVLVRLTRGL